MALRFGRTRRTPKRARVGSIRIELQHLVVEFSDGCRHLGQTVEIADVLSGLFKNSGTVTLLGFLMSGDHGAWFQRFEGVKCRDPFAAGFRGWLREVKWDFVVSRIPC